MELGALSIAVPSWATYAAVAAAGLAGATEAARRGFDVVGVFGLAFATGLGGLMLRDLLLGDITSNLLAEPGFLLTAFAVAVFGFFFAGFIARFDPILVILDGLAMGFLCSIGAEAALQQDLPSSSAVLVGVTTAVGGMVLRDVLAGNAPELVRPGVFVAIPAIIASVLFVVMLNYQLNPAYALLVAMAVSVFLRAGAYWFGWHTDSAATFSEKVWSFWIRKEKSPDDVDFVGPATYTDILAAQEAAAQAAAEGEESKNGD